MDYVPWFLSLDSTDFNTFNIEFQIHSRDENKFKDKLLKYWEF